MSETGHIKAANEDERRITRSVSLYALSAIIVLTALVGSSLVWAVIQQADIPIALATNTARASFDKDSAYRQWASSHGGVYVEPSEKTPPSPWMAHLPDRDVTSTTGKQLTLMNPAYMLREMMQDFGDLYGIKGRIVGKVYLNPANKADAWEAEAIDMFARGEADERIAMTTVGAEPHIRLIKPFRMQESCQKCHGHLEFANGDVRGAVGVSVPLAPYYAAEKNTIFVIAASHGVFWVIGVLGISLIAQRSTVRMIEKSRSEEENRLAARVFENTTDSIVITDPTGRILRVNESFTSSTGFSFAEAVGRTPALLRSHHHDDAFYAELWTTLLSEGKWVGEIWNRRKDGSIIVCWQSIVAVRGRGGDIRHFIGSFSDITEKHEAQRHIEHLAHYDALTDLPNRALFQDRLSHSLTLARRNKTSVGLLFLDLDGFKTVNDTLGHRAGDELLQQVARILRSNVRGCDTIARLGGDEFTIVLEPLTSTSNAAQVAEKITHSLSQSIRLGNRDVFVGASIGISVFPANATTADELIQQADMAMYRAKNAGKNCHRFYAPEMTAESTHKFEMATALRAAIANRDFTAFYQPKVCLDGQTIIGFEALARWPRPLGDMISPDIFIPIAEELHIVEAIDLAILEQACRQGKLWLDQGHDLSMAVNLSGIDLSSANLPERVSNILSQTGFPAGRLELELTETCVMAITRTPNRVMTQLRHLGCRLAIDDFGTGYSSLSYLKVLPVETLKIDRSFIRDIHRDARDHRLVGTIIDLARTMGLKVVAEGIETDLQMEMLTELGCDYGQGYLFSRPLRAADAETLLHRTPLAMP